MEAAVVARPDSVCDELPAVLVVRRNDADHPVEPQDIIDLLARKFARWQLPLPEDIHFVDSLPKTGVGKLDKKVLRKLLADQASRPTD
jgi:fatty-acyl-CoA synthase